MGCAASDEIVEGPPPPPPSSDEITVGPGMTDAAASNAAALIRRSGAQPRCLLTPIYPRPAPLTGAGLTSLCGAAAHSLTSVDLTEEAVPLVSADAVAAALTSLPALSDVSIRGAALPMRAVERIAQLRPAGLPTVMNAVLGGPCVDVPTLASISKVFPNLSQLGLCDLDDATDWRAVFTVLQQSNVRFRSITRITTTALMDEPTVAALRSLCSDDSVCIAVGRNASGHSTAHSGGCTPFSSVGHRTSVPAFTASDRTEGAASASVSHASCPPLLMDSTSDGVFPDHGSLHITPTVRAFVNGSPPASLPVEYLARSRGAHLPHRARSGSGFGTGTSTLSIRSAAGEVLASRSTNPLTVAVVAENGGTPSSVVGQGDEGARPSFNSIPLKQAGQRPSVEGKRKAQPRLSAERLACAVLGHRLVERSLDYRVAEWVDNTCPPAA